MINMNTFIQILTKILLCSLKLLKIIDIRLGLGLYIDLYFTMVNYKSMDLGLIFGIYIYIIL